MIYLTVALGIFCFVMLLLPTLGAARVTSEDTRRQELTEEREALLASLRELEATGAESALLTREKVRLAQVLSELDRLPAAPAAGGTKPVLPLALGLLLGVGLLTFVGSLTAFPKWRSAGLSVAEATQLDNATRLPALARRAEQTKSVQDSLAWGDAAWDARNYRDAAKAYTQVLTLQRDNAKAMRRTGFYLLSTPEMAGNGFSFIARAAELAPRDPEGQLLYGYALGLAGEYAQGLTVLKNYQALAPQSHEADDLILEYQGKVGAALDGQLVFAQNCAACHGANLEGGKGPKLLGSPALQNETALRAIVLNGATGMPAFPELRGAPLDALVKYLGEQKP